MFVDFYGFTLEHDESVFIPTTITKFAAQKILVDGKKVLDLGCGIAFTCYILRKEWCRFCNCCRCLR